MPRCSNHLREHEPLVCDHCVGLVRLDLARIVVLCGFAPYVAAASGYQGFGSAAAVLVGPVPEHATYRARRGWALSGALCRCPAEGRVCPDHTFEPEGPECKDWQTCHHYACRRRNGIPTCPALVEWLELVDDERHPLWVLGTWDMLVSELLGHRRTLVVTVPTAAAYLESNLTDLARRTDFAFDELAREISETVTHIEGVLLLAIRQETGAPCPVCHAQGRKAKSLVRRFVEDDVTGESDRWVCPTEGCGQEWTPVEYDGYVASESLRYATRLPASHIAKLYRVPEATVRYWAAEGRVRRRGFDGQRRQLYDVADVKVCRA